MSFPRKAFLTHQFKLGAPVLNVGVDDGIGVDMDTIRFEITWLIFSIQQYIQWGQTPCLFAQHLAQY